MKKLSLLVLCFVTVFCYGSDIIITKQSEKIEATIVEVTKSEIKYRKATNPEGPMFVIGIEEISSVIYNNGEVESFAAQTPINDTPNNDFMITRLGDNLYSYDGKTMNSKELGVFFQNNCQEAYRQWKKGTQLQNLGIAWSIIGPVLCLPVGLSLYACCVSANYDKAKVYYSIDYDMYDSGIAFMAIGAALTVASIPLLAIGTRDRNHAYLTYNTACAKSKNPAMSLNFQMNTNGVGLALKF